MTLSEILASPTIIASAVIGVIGFAVYLYYTRANDDREKIDRVPVFLFNYTRQVVREMARTFDGLVSYRKGGFIEDHKVAVDYRSGRVKRRGQEGIKAKKRKTVYVSRLQSITALNLDSVTNRPAPFDLDRYNMLKRTTRQRAVDEGKLQATKTDLATRLLSIAAAVSAVMTGAAWLFVVVSPSIA